jgi:hypothetical protein
VEYRHVQWGYTAIPTFIFLAAILPISATEDEASAAVTAAMAAFSIAIVIVVIVFSRLEVSVSGGRIVASFGFGRPHREIEISDVVAVRQVRNSWMQGWGVRKISDGWMYNVWGLDAVEVDLTSGKVFRIGTNDAENLLAVIALQIEL